MKQLLAIFLIGFLAIEAFGQPSVDIGIFGGAGTYFGDMTKTDFGKSVIKVAWMLSNSKKMFSRGKSASSG